jgi:hypothetical protein
MVVGENVCRVWEVADELDEPHHIPDLVGLQLIEVIDEHDEPAIQLAQRFGDLAAVLGRTPPAFSVTGLLSVHRQRAQEQAPARRRVPPVGEDLRVG